MDTEITSQGSQASLKPLKNLKIIFGSLNPGNSLEFCVQTLNHLEICERHKNRSKLFFLSKFHTVLPSTVF